MHLRCSLSINEVSTYTYYDHPPGIGDYLPLGSDVVLLCDVNTILSSHSPLSNALNALVTISVSPSFSLSCSPLLPFHILERRPFAVLFKFISCSNERIEMESETEKKRERQKYKILKNNPRVTLGQHYHSLPQLSHICV